ncbi:MAG: LamG domain-containing protein [Verrucomicrobiota bacterium]
MKRQTWSWVILLAAIFLQGTAIAQVRLTDVTTFGADASGSSSGQPDVWDTRPGGNYNNWLQSLPSGVFLNGPSDTNAQPDIILSPGTNVIRIYTESGIDNGNFGINLFFNGSLTPSISAFGPMLTTASQAHSFAADSAFPTWGASPATSPPIQAAGTLTFVSGNQLITLTDFYWATPSVYGLDQGGTDSLGADGTLDYVGGITLVVSTNPPITTAELNDGLVAYYPFNGNAHDASSNGNDGVVNGAVLTMLTTNLFGADADQAYSFNGGQQDIFVPDSASLEFTNRLTMSAWVNFSAGGTYNPRIISKFDVNGFELFTWGTSSQRQVGFLTYADAAILTSAQYINAGEWSYIVATYDGTNKNLYINGVLDTSAAASCIFNNSGNLTIGENSGNGLDNYAGLIDNVRIYNRALSPTEVAQLYALESEGEPSLSLLKISLNLTLYKQNTSRDNGATTITASPKTLKYATKDILKVLASDKFAQGYWPSNSFPKSAQLATDGKNFLVVKGTNILADVSDIMSLDFGNKEITSGTQDDVTGLAHKSEKKLQILNVTFDDSQVTGGNQLKFYLQGFLSETVSDTAPANGIYVETITGSMTDGTGEGSSTNVDFVCKGSATITGKTKLNF